MPLKIFKKKLTRACVVGLDGVPYTLLKDLMERGVMPKTREIVASGSILPMRVTLPEISSVSWSTFMTGKNPGEHGIFGFTDLKAGGYELRFPTFRDLKAPTIWDILGEHGFRSVVINQPSTYPARQIPGVLISGFVALDMNKAIYPMRYLPNLTKAGYRIDVDTEKCKDHPGRLLRELHALLDGRKKIADELWDKESWNLMEIVLTGTDRIHHFMWDAYENPSHEHHNAFLDYYRKVDAFVGHVHRRFSVEESAHNFFLLSDHGFCGARNEFYVNTVLEKEGYLGFSRDAAPSLESVTEKTRAFALDPARIYIHRRHRFPRGSVADGDVRKIKNELKEIFESIEHPGVNGKEKVVRRVFDAEDVYSGPQTAAGPDLLLIPKNGYDMKGRLGAEAPVGERRLQGMHTWDNAFFFSQRKDLLAETGEIDIVDVPRKILRSLDVLP